MTGAAWRCPACAGAVYRPRFSRSSATDLTVDGSAVVPSSDLFGRTVGLLNQCLRCGHAALSELPAREVFESAYLEAVDDVALREEAGQLATATRDLERIEQLVRPGRLLDVGCWTGSFLVASAKRGWLPEGLEPSEWACERARERGCTVRTATLEEVSLEPQSYRAIVAADVIEHLLDPAAAVQMLAAALEPGGVLFATVPDAGSAVARALGRRWWSVLPMHVQYFTRRSMTELLTRSGLRVDSITTHPKVFSVDYYAGRVAALVPRARGATARVARSRLGTRAVAPDLRDRMAVLAQRR